MPACCAGTHGFGRCHSRDARRKRGVVRLAPDSDVEERTRPQDLDHATRLAASGQKGDGGALAGSKRATSEPANRLATTVSVVGQPGTTTAQSLCSLAVAPSSMRTGWGGVDEVADGKGTAGADGAKDAPRAHRGAERRAASAVRGPRAGRWVNTASARMAHLCPRRN